MSSATSAVTYTSVYTDSEPGRAFWGADDEEVSEGGIPRVIVLGYDGLPIQPVAPPSPDYIPGPEDPQTPLVWLDNVHNSILLAQYLVYWRFSSHWSTNAITFIHPMLFKYFQSVLGLIDEDTSWGLVDLKS
ncbi:hypothetical protein Tco_0132447 [Tanacetum coccineum]